MHLLRFKIKTPIDTDDSLTMYTTNEQDLKY